MYFFRTEKGVIDHLSTVTGRKIGFVPTMGALHEGHKSLIEQSAGKGCYTVVSIFVNPTQFNNPQDLEKYPRTLEADIDFLQKSNCEVLFYPDEDEIYKEDKTPVPQVNLGHLADTLEGAFRPGHFNGVMQVVTRLLNIVNPDYLFMGQKDLQQFVILKTMIDQSSIPVEIISCPIIREPGGLAKSSRNQRISEAHMRNSSILYEALLFCKENYAQRALGDLKARVVEMFNNSKYDLEYFEFLNASNLAIVNYKNESDDIIAAVAAWAGDVRLIDNMLVEGQL